LDADYTTLELPLSLILRLTAHTLPVTEVEFAELTAMLIVQWEEPNALLPMDILFSDLLP